MYNPLKIMLNVSPLHRENNDPSMKFGSKGILCLIIHSLLQLAVKPLVSKNK